tara:strand:+ start:377 stop:979 length:603 start_codon:yes stop_codon:yes gene_type:complete
MTAMIHVIDNYFSNPFEIRKRALLNHDEFESDVDFLWPGRRWKYGVDQFTIKKILQDVNRITESSFTNPRFHYQIITEEYLRGAIHRDEAEYTVVIFLSPEPPPNSGVSVYGKISDQKVLNKFNLSGIKSNFMRSNKTRIDKIKYGLSLNVIDKFFGEENHIANQFNRCVIFNSQHYHKAQRFFGNSIKDSRLTIIGFVS